ncbi:MAG: FAD-dependent oxidoreductase [Desulfurococcus sp.]|nr:FAD-dependent oxidoreductase [Desulfurococcus sp.]
MDRALDIDIEVAIIADYMNFGFHCREKPRENGLRVAVVGAGPAGLSAAGYLACNGYSIDVYDKLPVPGGLIVHAIPPWRIPVERVLGGIKDLEERLGVKFITKVKVYSGSEPRRDEGDEFAERTVGLEEIVDNYDLVLISTGTWLSKIPRIPGSSARGVESALSYVHKFKLYELGLINHKPEAGRRVLVVGGGYSAIDAAEWALRSKAEVYVAYRRTLREAPAGVYEMERIRRMGAEIIELASPIEVIVEKDSVKAVKLQRMQLGPPDETGRPKPIPVPGSEFTIEADVVVFATGESPTPPLQQAVDYMNKLGVKLDKDGRIIVDEMMRTGNPKIFAAGDVVTGPSKIGPAIKSGLYAARFMHNLTQVKKAIAVER